ncbi:MAG: hypothetical protein J6T78_05180 [Bacteroidaceae bacterium]|nr:hypothetical protein [Bacteroidaceae bacterium]
MKRTRMSQRTQIVTLLVFIFAGVLLSCSTNASKNEITAEMALEGVSNYCHNEYDWSVAEENPNIMSVTMGEESDSAYQVVFRSYTGSFVYFYVDKESGSIRMEEYVPSLDIKSDAGTIDLHDYLKNQ